jgi:hypothetical protein
MGFDKEASWEAVCLHGGDTTMQVEWLQQNQVLLWDFNELPFVVLLSLVLRRANPPFLGMRCAFYSGELARRACRDGVPVYASEPSRYHRRRQ